MCSLHCLYLFFFNVTATTEIYTLSLHDALPISTEADMAADFPDYEVGAIPPIGPDTPAEVFDMRLLAYQRVLCAAGDHEHSLLLDPTDIVRVSAAQTADLRQD